MVYGLSTHGMCVVDWKKSLAGEASHVSLGEDREGADAI